MYKQTLIKLLKGEGPKEQRDTYKAKVALEAAKGVSMVHELATRFEVHTNIIAKK